jgi:hypothetical protein
MGTAPDLGNSALRHDLPVPTRRALARRVLGEDLGRAASWRHRRRAEEAELAQRLHCIWGPWRRGPAAPLGEYLHQRWALISTHGQSAIVGWSESASVPGVTLHVFGLMPTWLSALSSFPKYNGPCRPRPARQRLCSRSTNSLYSAIASGAIGVLRKIARNAAATSDNPMPATHAVQPNLSKI